MIGKAQVPITAWSLTQATFPKARCITVQNVRVTSEEKSYAVALPKPDPMKPIELNAENGYTLNLENVVMPSTMSGAKAQILIKVPNGPGKWKQKVGFVDIADNSILIDGSDAKLAIAP